MVCAVEQPARSANIKASKIGYLILYLLILSYKKPFPKFRSRP